MKNLFESKVTYEKTLPNGKQKKVTEPYIVDALSFTEAEARIIEEITPFISGDFSVSTVSRSNISEIFWDETGDKWYKVKPNFITIDGNSGLEKKTATHILVQASDFKTAFDNFLKGMKGTLADYEIAEIKETKIMDVFPYKSNSDEESNN